MSSVTSHGAQNPFQSAWAAEHSCYAEFRNGRLMSRWPGRTPSQAASRAHQRFREMIGDPAYSCLGGKASLSANVYRFGYYRQLGDEPVTHGLARDLFSFVQERAALKSHYTIFVAAFGPLRESSEETFEAALWLQLQRLHALDEPLFPWDPHASADPASPHFAFSFAGVAFFVIGMHPESSRLARRSELPMLVFNAHDQVEELKRRKLFDKLQVQIRAREMALDGSLNPNLGNYGSSSEAREYSGRVVPADWVCPFTRRNGT